MARNGSGVYSLPAAYLAVTGDTVLASQHNTPLEDLESDMNAARPIVAGGTGATSASAARTGLGLEIGSDVQAYSADLANYVANPLTVDELGQLQNINAVTISEAQWGYIGAADQGITTTSTVSFGELTTGDGGTLPTQAGGTVLTVANTSGVSDFCSAAIISGATNGQSALFFGDTDDENAGYITYSNASDRLDLGTGTNLAMRIDSTGRVAVGRAVLGGANTKFELRDGDSGVTPGSATRFFVENDASCLIEVAGGTASTTGLRFSDSNGPDFRVNVDHSNSGETEILCEGSVAFKPGGGSDEHLRVTDSGLSFIAFSQANYDLSSASGFGVHATTATGYFNVQCVSTTPDGTAVLSVFRGTGRVAAIRGNGDMVNTNNSYGAISDARRKAIEGPVTGALSRLSRVDMYYYTRTDTEDPIRQAGPVAQELEKIYPRGEHPNFVKHDPELDLYSVNYMAFVPELVAALQEETRARQYLEHELQSLQARIENLEMKNGDD